MKLNFSISGKVLNEDEQGIEAMMHIFGYEDEGYLYTDQKGNFVLNITNFPFPDILFKQYLITHPKIDEKKYGTGTRYFFRIRHNRHLKLKIYPFSQRVVKEQ